MLKGLLAAVAAVALSTLRHTFISASYKRIRFEEDLKISPSLFFQRKESEKTFCFRDFLHIRKIIDFNQIERNNINEERNIPDVMILTLFRCNNKFYNTQR